MIIFSWESNWFFFDVIISIGGSSCLSSKNSYEHLVLHSSIFFFFQPSFIDINTSSNKFLHSYHLLLLFFLFDFLSSPHLVHSYEY